MENEIDAVEQEVTVVEEETNALAYFDRVEAGLDLIETKYATVPDATTPEGKEEIRLGLAEMRPLRTAVDKHRLSLGRKLRQDLKDINDIGKRIIGRIIAVEDPFKEAKKVADEAEAQAELQRVTKIKTRIQEIANLVLNTENMDSNSIRHRISDLVIWEVPQDFAEFKEDANSVKITALKKLSERLEVVREAEDRIAAQTAEAEQLVTEKEQFAIEQAAIAKRLTEEKEQFAIEQARVTKDNQARDARIVALEEERNALLAAVEKEMAQKIANEKAVIVAEEARIREAKEAEILRVREAEEAERLRLTTAKLEEARRLKEVEEAKVGTIEITSELMSSEDLATRLAGMAQGLEDRGELVHDAEDEEGPIIPETLEAPVSPIPSELPEAPAIPRRLDTVESPEWILETINALRQTTGIGLRTARNVVEQIKFKKIPHVTWG